MDATTRPIRFWHQGQVVEATGLPPTTTVLYWLREHAGCTGTKEGCNEGDCGACTVAVAERLPGGELSLRNINACLMFLPALDGKALVTVEDLQAMAGGGLHPVQQAMVAHHGSQCGFCTPGFVMTMWTRWEQALHEGVTPTRQDWADALAGNLCRCTGYRPILDAAQACVQAASQPGGALDAQIDRTQLLLELAQLQQSGALHYRAFDAAHGGERAFSAPRSSDELADCLVRNPEARVLGGATDIGLWTNKGHRDVGHLVYTGAVADLGSIHTQDGRLRIGGAASLEAAWGALAGQWPSLMDLWRRFASPPVRHAGTLAGNIANGSPIGDGPPVLMALRADLVLRQGDRRRTVALDTFYQGYQRNVLEPGEFIEWIEIPLRAPHQRLRAWKISKRYDSDISAVCGGFGLTFDPAAPERLQSVVLAFGGMAATVQRARRAEQALLEQGWSQTGVSAAQAALALDFAPLSDLRATSAYRLEGAQALLQRCWWSIGPAGAGESDPGEVAMLEVWR